MGLTLSALPTFPFKNQVGPRPAIDEDFLKSVVVSRRYLFTIRLYLPENRQAFIYFRQLHQYSWADHTFDA